MDHKKDLTLNFKTLELPYSVSAMSWYISDLSIVSNKSDSWSEIPKFEKLYFLKIRLYWSSCRMCLW